MRWFISLSGLVRSLVCILHLINTLLYIAFFSLPFYSRAVLSSRVPPCYLRGVDGRTGFRLACQHSVKGLGCLSLVLHFLLAERTRRWGDVRWQGAWWGWWNERRDLCIDDRLIN